MLRSSSILIAALSTTVALCSCGGTLTGAADGSGGAAAGSTNKSDGSAGGTTATSSGGAAGSRDPGTGGGDRVGTGGAGGASSAVSTGGQSSSGASGVGGRASGGIGGATARSGGASGTGGRIAADAGGGPDAGSRATDARMGGAAGSTMPDAGATATGGRQAGTGGSTAAGTGGSTSAGTGGSTSAGTGAHAPKILWTDSIQTKGAPWGLDGYGAEYPVGTTITPNDANGANFSVVPDPLGGSALAIRHFATFDTGGARSQGGIYSDVNTVFGKQAKSAEGVWVAQEWYFPSALDAKGESYCWINLWDFHSVDANRGNRWHTSPGLMLAQDGSMRVQFNWGGPAYNINQNSKNSTIAIPVGRWFDIEMHYVWSDQPNATLTVWIDGQVALEQTGVQTRDSSHQIVETYLKFYGSTQGHGAWAPTPSLKYTRNVRVAGERIWR